MYTEQMETTEMNKRYILHVMGMDSSKYGGIERFNVALSEALLEKGFHSVFVYESEPASKEFMSDLKESEAQVFVSNSRKHPLRFCLDFVRLLRQYHPMLVHAHFTKARFYAIPIAYLLGISRLFFTIHSRMDPKNRIKPLTRLWYERANKMAKVIAVSDDIESNYRANWPQATTKRIYLGVETISGNKHECRSKLGIPERQTMVLTVANFNQIKGLDVLCKAISLLKQRGELGSEVRFYIVGQPESDKLELEALLSELGLCDFVEIVGISNEVPSYMCAADFYVQPSRSEGLPLALMEATSASLPIIGTRVGGIPEIVREGYNGLLVDSENERMLADAISKMLSDIQMRSSFSEHSFKLYHELFSIDNGVRQTISYYEV